MKTRSFLQRRSNSESSDRLVANIKPRSWGDPLHEQATQPQPIQHDFSHVDLFAHDPGSRTIPRGVQAKLTVGAPNDQYEQEADRVAEQVMSTPDSPTQQPVSQRQNGQAQALQAKPLATTPSVPSIQAKFDWTRQDLEAGAGTKRFRSTEYKNIVRILHNYTQMQNPLREAHISGLQELLNACLVWTEKNKKDSSAKVGVRRQVLQRLAADVTHEIAALRGPLKPINGRAPAPQAVPSIPATIPDNAAPVAIDPYANVPRGESLEESQSLTNSSASVLDNLEEFQIDPGLVAAVDRLDEEEAHQNDEGDAAPVSEPLNNAHLNKGEEDLYQNDAENAASTAAPLDNAPSDLDAPIEIGDAETEQLRTIGIVWDSGDELWYWNSMVSVSGDDVQRLLRGTITIEELMNPDPDQTDDESEAGSEDDESEAGSEDDEEEQPKSMLPPDKAARYQERALKLQGSGNLIGAAVQYTRAYSFDPLIDYVFNAAQLFKEGEDFERADLWYRKTIAADSSSSQAQTAREYLTSRELSEQPKYQTSGLTDHAESLYESVKFGDQGYALDKAEKRNRKDSGLYKEEIVSNNAASLLTSNPAMYLQKLIDAQAELVAATTPETREAAQVRVRRVIEVIENMALGQNIQIPALVDEYRQKQNNPNAASPLMDTIAGFKVQFLSTTADRDAKKLFSDGKIKQGAPPRSAEAEQGYDTGNLSTNFAGKGFAIFVMSGDGAIYADQHKVSQFHHTSFLAASETAASGEIKVESGNLTAITNKSGHYQPGAFFLTQALDEFQSTFGQSLSSVDLVFHNSRGKVSWNGKAAGFAKDVQQMTDLGKYNATFGDRFTPPEEIQNEVDRLKSPQNSAPVALENQPLNQAPSSDDPQGVVESPNHNLGEQQADGDVQLPEAELDPVDGLPEEDAYNA